MMATTSSGDRKCPVPSYSHGATMEPSYSHGAPMDAQPMPDWAVISSLWPCRHSQRNERGSSMQTVRVMLHSVLTLRSSCGPPRAACPSQVPLGWTWPKWHVQLVARPQEGAQLCTEAWLLPQPPPHSQVTPTPGHGSVNLPVLSRSPQAPASDNGHQLARPRPPGWGPGVVWPHARPPLHTPTPTLPLWVLG